MIAHRLRLESSRRVGESSIGGRLSFLRSHTNGLLAAAAVAPPGTKRLLRPGEALEHELARPARRPGPERGREGPSFGF